MTIVAHGVDLVDIEKFQKLYGAADGFALQRCLSVGEMADAGNDADRWDRLAGRFAVKEAVMKALGVGFGDEVGFLDVLVKTAPSGAPSVTFHGNAATLARRLGISRWLVSTAHDGNVAVASVIAVRDPVA